MFKPEFPTSKRGFINSLLGYLAGRLRRKLPEKDKEDNFIKEKDYFDQAKEIITGEINSLSEGVYKKKEEKNAV